MARFNKSSVNTLRVTTLVCADGSVKVVTAVFRVGRQGKVADNFHHYGLAALIDNFFGYWNCNDPWGGG